MTQRQIARRKSRLFRERGQSPPALQKGVDMSGWLFDLLFAYPAKFVATLLMIAVTIGLLALPVCGGILVFRVLYGPNNNATGRLRRPAAVTAGVVAGFYLGMVLYAAQKELAFFLLEASRALS
ncbi:hypothetical protein LC092_05465 [Stappia stellulata]|uniref:hypothetical protein n=1 Tax=Stappia stellulata TaxID=71235 RepID=UPI001CD6B71E|nr:hypothetical protein [Stappia stellulata]MCA1241876.1 hypothetical protein [Stappia stellulata]